MWYFSDLETLDLFLAHSQRRTISLDGKLGALSPLETAVNENSTKEGELLVYKEPKTAGNISIGDVSTC